MAALVAAAIALAVAFTSGEPEPSRAQAASGVPARTYVMVVDGLRPREVTPALMPNVSGLLDESTWYEQARALFPAETLPNHAGMATGMLPARNGIVGNKFLLEAPVGKTTQYASDPRYWITDTMITRFERRCGNGISTATILSKSYLFHLFGTGPSGTSSGDQIVADLHWNPQPQVPVSEHAPDAATMSTFLPWMRSAPTPQFAFVNLGDVDRAGHVDEGGAFGEDNFHQATITDTDTLIGQFVTELKDKGWWDESVLILLSDHGMDWSVHENDINLVQALGAAGFEGSQFAVVNNGAADTVYFLDPDPAIREEMTDVIKGVEGVETVLTDRAPKGSDEYPRAIYGLDSHRVGSVVALAKPGYRFAGSNPIPGNHGHTATQHNTLLVTGGHPSLATVGPDATGGKSVPGADVWNEQANRPPAGGPLPPQGGPGTLSVAPTVGRLLGLPDPEGGYDGQLLTDAFDPGVLSGSSDGVCPALGPPPEDGGEEPPPGDDDGDDGTGSEGGGAQPGTQETQPAGEGAVAGTEARSGTATTSLLSDRTRVVQGRPFQLSGRVERRGGCRGAEWVEIRRRARGAREFTEFAEVPVGRDGAWNARLTSDHSAAYVAVPQTNACTAEPSRTRDVLIAARIADLSLRGCAGAPTLSGRVVPGRARSRVLLQTRFGAHWRTLRSARLDRRSRFRFALPRCGLGRTRIVWPQQGDANLGAVRGVRT